MENGSNHRRGRSILLVIGIVGSLLFLYEGVRPNILPKRFGTVVEGQIYRSGELTGAATRHVVQENNIRTIVDLGAHEPGSREEQRAQATADALGVKRHVFNLEGDATGDTNYYVQALEIITDPDAQPVLIHCAAGSERTGCAIALYRHLYQGVSLDEAYEETHQFGHSSTRNPHLHNVLNERVDEIAESLRTGVPIDFNPNSTPDDPE